MTFDKKHRKDLETILLVCLCFAAMSIYSILVKHSTKTWPEYLLATVSILFALSLVSTHIAHALAYSWMKLGEFLGAINSRIILGLVFFLFLTPIALMARLSGRDRLKIRKAPKDTNYVTRNHTYTADDLKNTW
jgi:Saxitoxin biosynthesis operon protein SxtJ